MRHSGNCSCRETDPKENLAIHALPCLSQSSRVAGHSIIAAARKARGVPTVAHGRGKRFGTHCLSGTVHARECAGSHRTVKRSVAPLRGDGRHRCVVSDAFGDCAGWQSQIDCGWVRTHLRSHPVGLYLSVPTSATQSQRGYCTYASSSWAVPGSARGGVCGGHTSIR